MSSNQTNSLTAAVQAAVNAPPPATTNPPLPSVPTTAPSSSNPTAALPPGWRFQPGNPGTMASVSKVVDSRVIDSTKIYNGGLSPEYSAHIGQNPNPGMLGANVAAFASNTVQGPASIVELARALKNDPQLIFEFVYNNIEWQPGWGVLKGALGALLDGSGNAFDQSMLLVALLRQAGFTANYVLGQIQMPVASYDAWFGTDSSTNSYCCYWYAQYANIPGSAPVWNGSAWTMVMSHVWVQVVVSGTTYVLDPSQKAYTRKSPVANLGTILGYNAATFLSDAESGATVDPSGNFVQNMNTSNIAADLTTMTANLRTYIQNNAVGSAPAGTATVDDVLGGQAIVPITLPFAWQTALSYEMPGDTPTIWTGDVPLTYKTTLEVQYPLSPSGWAIDQTFTSDQLAGGRLTLTFDGSLHPVLTLNGTVVATGSQAQSPGTWNSIQLTVNHNAYASPVYPQQWWQSFIYAGQYYLIGNAWGSAGRGQADFHQTQLAAALANSSSTNEAINGEYMSTIWWAWVSQASRVADLTGRLRNTYMNFFHEVGMVSLFFTGGVPTPATDIGGVSGFSSTLNYDFTQLAPTNTIIAMHGVALEAATLAQFNGIKPGVSTTTLIDKANRTAVVTLGGTVTVGNTLTLTVHDTALSGGTKSDSYTVITGDTLTSIAAALASAINGDSSLSAIGVTATSSGAVVLISSTSANQTTYTSSTSGGATETISIAWSKIYLANSSNWTAGINIDATLTANGVAAGTISNIGNYITSSGFAVMVPDQPAYTLGSWNGDGYWALPPYSGNGGGFGLINNVSKGGNGQPGKGTGKNNNTNPGNNQNGQNNGEDPVGLFSGDFFYNRVDMTLGSQPFPYSLSFERTYSSASQYNSRPLGWGWTHNHAITAQVSSDGLLSMGQQFALQGAATIAELFVASDLATDTTQPIAKVVTMSLSDKWWIDQLVNNLVHLSFNKSDHFFVKQPDGTYTAPAVFPSTLTLSAGLYMLTTPKGYEYNFNSSGQISSWVAPNGVTITYTYSSGLLSTISNGLGRTLTLNYTSGKLTSVTDGTGRSVQFGFDVNGNLNTFTDALSNVITYQYDQPGRMTAYFLPANPATAFITNVYDSLSRVKTQANARGQVTTNYFAGVRTEYDDPVGNATILYFNRWGSVARSINALGFETDTLYDGLNRPTQITLPEGNQTQLTYDSNNNILTRTLVPKSGSGLSNVVQNFTYDPTWARMKTFQDGNLNTTTYTYDPTLGNLLKIQRPAVAAGTPTVIQRWNSRGQLISYIDETGIQTQYTYDSTTEKLLTQVVNTNWTATIGGTITTGNTLTLTAHDSSLSGGLESVSYTVLAGDTLTTIAAGLAAAVNADSHLAAVGIVAYSSGAVVALATAAGNTTTWTQSVTGTETIAVAAGLNLTTSYGYDSVGNVNSVTDPNTNITSFVSDNERRLTQRTEASPFGYVTNFSYNANNFPLNIQRQTGGTPAWQTFSWTYSVSNEKLTAVDTGGKTTTWTYDAADRVQTMTDAQGRQWQYAYDALNRVNQVTDPTNTITDTRTFTNNGYLASIKDARSNTTQYTRDGLDRQNKTIYADSTFEQNSSYDSNGNVLTRLTRSGNSVVSTYDALNRLSTKTPTGQAAITYSYDLNGRLILMNKAGTVGSDPSIGNLQFFFDTAGRFVQEQYPDGKAVTHGLDSNGNRTKTTWPDGYYISRIFDQMNRLTGIQLNGSGSNAVSFSYNQLSQRTQLTYTNGASVVYAPQPNGDVTSITHNFVGSNITFNYGFNNVHEPISVGRSDPSYTWHPAAAGSSSYGTADNVNKYPTVGGNTYSYDGNKNLTGDGTWTYTFDTENHLLTATATGTSATLVYDPMHRQSEKTVGSAQTRYVYSGWQRIADYNGATNTLQNRYIYGTGLDDALLMVSSSGTLTFLHADIAGSIIATSNSSGAVTNKNVYDPFGSISTLGGTSIGFTGQRFDPELNLHYYKLRYYSQSLGRFLQTDPVGYTGEDFNLYSYVRNSPLKYTDPTGLYGWIYVNKVTVSIDTLLSLPGHAPRGGEYGLAITNHNIQFMSESMLLGKDANGNYVNMNMAALQAIVAGIFTLTNTGYQIGLLIHTHNAEPGTDPYVFSTPDLNKPYPQIIVTSDGLIGYAPPNWKSQSPAGWFDYNGGFHKSGVDENGNPYSEVDPSDPNKIKSTC